MDAVGFFCGDDSVSGGLGCGVVATGDGCVCGGVCGGLCSGIRRVDERVDVSGVEGPVGGVVGIGGRVDRVG